MLEELEWKTEKTRAALEEAERQGKDDKTMKKRFDSAKKATKTQREKIRKIKNSYHTSSQKVRKQVEESSGRSKETIDRMSFQVEAQEITRDYNLGTSLKNYIDPRIYYDWGRCINFNWRSYYPATLQKKFSWIEEQQEEE